MTQAMRNLLSGPDGRRRVLAGMALESVAKAVESLAKLLTSDDDELLQCTVLCLNYFLDDEDGRRRVLAALPPAVFDQLIRAITPLLGSIDDDVASTSAFLVFKIVAVPDGARACKRESAARCASTRRLAQRERRGYHRT